MKYEQVWNAVDKLAKINGLSPSGLAKKAGLDSTTFNKSKRLRPDGKKRFPSLESINKIISVCNMSFNQFCRLADKEIGEDNTNSIAYSKYSALENTKIDNDSSFNMEKWNKIKFPDGKHNLYAVELDKDANSDFESGTVLIISQNSEIRRGDKVIISYKDGNIFIGEFMRRTATTIEIAEAKKKETILSINDINFINRILWASQ